MEKFTKTAQIDTTPLQLIEEDTPKTSKAGKIVALIICLLLSIGIWVYVVETDTTTHSKTYTEIEVTVLNADKKFNISAEKVTVEVTATQSEIADIRREDIVVEIDLMGISAAGEYEVSVKQAYINGGHTVKSVSPKSKLVKVQLTEK